MRVDLRQERERRGLTLDQVSDKARIPRHYLDALETGQLADLPRGPFVQSYRRQYLAFLGFPPQAEVQPSRPAPVAPARAATPAPAAPVQPELAPTLPIAEAMVDEPTMDAEDPGRTRTITRHYDNVPVVRLVLAGFLVTMALVLGMKLLSGLIDRAAEAGTAPSVGQVEAVPVAPEAVEEATGPAQPEPVTTAAVATPAMRVHLRAHERVRVEVSLDGTHAFSGWLEAGERHDFHGSEVIAIEVSDLTRLTIAYNGDKVEPLGNLSHPRRLVFEHDPG